MQHIGIIDYGMGNLTSVYNAFTALGCRVKILGTPHDIGDVSHLVLPGVGAFADGIKNLHAGDWIAPMNAAVLKKGVTFLGGSLWGCSCWQRAAQNMAGTMAWDGFLTKCGDSQPWCR
ncbi:MAG: hypothetical protein WD049_05920 [Candidatus Paceibacterota bacterium]